MRVYADTSFLLKLLAPEPGSQTVIAEYRRLRHPAVFFLPLHALEVRNAILQRAFFQRRALPSSERQPVAHERDTALARLDHFVTRRALLDVTLDMDTVLARATQLSATHTERLGARAIDLLHVASALTLESELFLTTDERQALLAKAEGLKVASIG